MSDRAPVARVESPTAEVVLARVAVTGLAGGLASGLLGIGGGLLMVPLLATWAGVPVKRAIGTSLLTVAFVAAVGVAVETRVAPENLHWLPALLLTIGALAGSQLGSRLLVERSPLWLARALAAVLIVAALRMSGVLGAGLESLGASRSLLGPGVEADAWWGPVGHVLAGLLSGVVSAAFGVGGGIVAVPALAVLHPSWAFQACRATSLAMMVPSALLGAALAARHGHVDGATARALAVPAVAGSVLGVVLANRVPSRPLEALFSAVLLASACRLARRQGDRVS